MKGVSMSENTSVKSENGKTEKETLTGRAKNRHLKRNVLALSAAAIILTCGGAGILAYQFSGGFDLRAQMFAESVSSDTLQVTYTPHETGWLYFRKEGTFTVTEILEDGSKKVSEMELEGYALPYALHAEMKVPLNGHPAFETLRSFGVSRIVMDADFDGAEIRFSSETEKPHVIESEQYAGTFTAGSLQGLIEVPYETGDSPVALSVGAADVIYVSDLMPGMKVDFGELSYTAPLSSFIRTESFAVPVFSVLNIGHITAETGMGRYVLSDFSFERSLHKDGSLEHNKLSVSIAPDGKDGSVNIEGNNRPLGRYESEKDFAGQFEVFLRGPFFERLEDPLLATYIERGLIDKKDGAYHSTVRANHGELILNGRKLTGGELALPGMEFPESGIPDRGPGAPMVKP